MFSSSVGSRILLDVPLGAYLSGGIDSSLVVARMQKTSMSLVKTFTIGVGDKSLNQAEYVKSVAHHLGADQTEFYLTERVVFDVVLKLATIWDEPFADWSQNPTYLVSALALQHETIALCGDGGDELFGGYGRYTKAPVIWSKVSKYPIWSRKAVSKSCAISD